MAENLIPPSTDGGVLVTFRRHRQVASERAQYFATNAFVNFLGAPDHRLPVQRG